MIIQIQFNYDLAEYQVMKTAAIIFITDNIQKLIEPKK